MAEIAVQHKKLYSLALTLAVITVVYNFAEGLISTHFGFHDESFTLFGFGMDSFIEVISGIGIIHMVLRLKRYGTEKRGSFEKLALRITGFAFFLLVFGLVVSAVITIYTGHKPVTTFWGVVVASVSIVTMWLLIWGKMKAGKKLNSHAIVADAQCTKVCLYMSLILLVSSGAYALFRVPYLDSAGMLGLAYFSFNEGRECFEKANNPDLHDECC